MMNSVELQREDEAFQLELFWKKHEHYIMQSAMCRANKAEGGPACDCIACAASHRHYLKTCEVAENKPCTFKPWFEQVLREHEMSIGHGLPDVPIWVDGTVINSGRDVLDDGQHFSDFGPLDWFQWNYGSKLWKATSVRDPEIAKLERLLNWLNPLGEWV